MVISTFLNGSRCYLVQASKHAGKTFVHMSYDRDLAYQWKDENLAARASELLGINIGSNYDVIYVTRSN